jgi:hypothetical protein
MKNADFMSTRVVFDCGFNSVFHFPLNRPKVRKLEVEKLEKLWGNEKKGKNRVKKIKKNSN